MAFVQSELSSLKKHARNWRNSRLTTGQWHTSHITYCWEHWYSQWFGTQSGGCNRDTQNYPSDREGNWHFAEVSGTHHTQRHSATVPEKTILAWSVIQQSITDQAINQCEIVLLRVSKPKANTLNICCDVFVRNCQFVMTFNAALLQLWTDWHVFYFTR